MDKVCGNCIHFDLCESEFSVSNANPDDQACDDFVEDGGYSDEIYRQSKLIGNPIHRDYLSTDIKFNKDERIRKAIIGYIDHGQHYGVSNKDMIAWLEKQKYTQKDVDDAYLKGICDAKQELEKQGEPAKLSEEEQNRFAKGVLTSCAMSFIDYLDAHKYDGKMCVSNGECEDIENAFHNAMWDRLHRYYCKYIEKQGEQDNWAEELNTKIKELHRQCLAKIQEYVTPCLGKMSEEDERIRKEIINLINDLWKEKQGLMTDRKDYERYIEWLEKQGEQKPQGKTALEALKEKEINNANCATPKIKPKFHKGDWIINPETGNVLQIKDILLCGDKGNYEFDNGSMLIESVDKHYKKWTIQDAKDGDILVCEDNIPFIFKNFDRFHPECPVAYCGIDENRYFIINIGDGWWTDEKCYPATKKQRELLFKKIEEAGYEWNPDKKELKKIEPIPIFRVGDTLKRKGKDYTFVVDRIQGGYYHCDHSNGAFFPIEEQDNWELVEQKPAEWSEEDEENFKGVMDALNFCNHESVNPYDIDPLYLVSWLKSIKDRVQPKQEWSEHRKLIKNDACVALTEKMLYDIILDLKVFRDKDSSSEGKAAYQREIDWLENLKKELEE